MSEQVGLVEVEDTVDRRAVEILSVSIQPRQDLRRGEAGRRVKNSDNAAEKPSGPFQLKPPLIGRLDRSSRVLKRTVRG
jgi:hypothetical protein